MAEKVVVNTNTTNSVISTTTQNVVSKLQEDNTISLSTQDTIVVEREISNIITSGPIGPQGPQGQPGTPGGEEDMPYAKRVDFVSDTEFYKGEAAVGEQTSAASWRIQKTILGNDGDVTVTWADGNSNFDNVWDNRVSLSYS